MCRPSSVQPPETRRLRHLTHCRRALVQDRAHEQQLSKASVARVSIENDQRRPVQTARQSSQELRWSCNAQTDETDRRAGTVGMVTAMAVGD